MFHAGAQYVICGHSFRTYDWAAAGALVDLLLKGSDLDGPVSQ
jgi:4-hydroxyphenylacetate 3-monooxygenase